LVISVRANGPERNSARDTVGAKLSIHPSAAPIDKAFTEKWLKRRVKSISLHGFVARRKLDGCRHRSLAGANKYQDGWSYKAIGEK
jgi:hypothetical protein